MDLNKIKEVFSDEAFVKSILELETPEQVQQALKEKDVELSVDEIKEVGDLLNRYANDELTDQEKKAIELAQNSDGELNEDELESVSGGAVVTFTIGALIALIGTAILGTGTAVASGVYVHRTTRGRW